MVIQPDRSAQEVINMRAAFYAGVGAGMALLTEANQSNSYQDVRLRTNRLADEMAAHAKEQIQIHGGTAP